MATSDVTSPLFGMSDVQLQQALLGAQAAYVQLRNGTNVVTIQYAQAEGSRSVTYQQTNMASLRMWITDLQRALYPNADIPKRRRMVPVF